MNLKTGLLGLAAALLFSGVTSASTMRVVVVETSDVAAYTKALADGEALLRTKGSSGQLRAWVARYAGANTGSIVVSIEFPNLEALAKDDALMRNDADLRAWLAKLGHIRKIVSDSIYEELKP